jgi:hypothetical protein
MGGTIPLPPQKGGRGFSEVQCRTVTTHHIFKFVSQNCSKIVQFSRVFFLVIP